MKAFLVLPFKDPYETIVREVISPILSSNKFSIVRGDDPKKSKPIIDDIVNGIINSDLIVALIVDKNPNCYYELGLCHAFNKTTIIITDNAKNIAFNINQLRVIEINKEIDPTFSKFKIKFELWVKNFITSPSSQDSWLKEISNKTYIANEESIISLLESVNNTNEGSMEFSTEYEIENGGNCIISGNYKYWPKNLSYLFRSGINLDKAGTIENIEVIDLDSNAKLNYILKSESPIKYFIYSIFNDSVSNGSCVRFQLKFYAKNFISNLFDSKKSIISYDHRHLIETKSASAHFVFPLTLLEKGLKLQIADCSNVDLINTRLEHELKGNKIYYKIDNSNGGRTHNALSVEIKLEKL